MVGFSEHLSRDAGSRGRHGDRTVKGSTAFPLIYQVLPLIVVQTPHLEVDLDVVIKRHGTFVGDASAVGVSKGFNAYIHPVERNFLAGGNALNHVHRAGSDARQEQFAGANFLSARTVGHPVVVSGITMARRGSAL